MPGSARLCLGPAGPVHDSELVRHGVAVQGDGSAGMAVWYSQTSLTSLLWQYSIDLPQQLSPGLTHQLEFWLGSQKTSAVLLLSSKENDLWVPCPPWIQLRKGRSYSVTTAKEPTSLPSLKLHDCWHHTGRVPFALSPILAMQTSSYLIIYYYCICRVWSYHIWGPLWPSKCLCIVQAIPGLVILLPGLVRWR